MVTPFSTSLAQQPPRKAPFRQGCGKIWRCYGLLHCVAILAQRYASHPDFACNAPHKGLIQRFHNSHPDSQDTEALPLPGILAGARVENKGGLFVSGT